MTLDSKLPLAVQFRSLAPFQLPDDLWLGQPPGQGAALGVQGREAFDIIGNVHLVFCVQLKNLGLNHLKRLPTVFWRRPGRVLRHPGANRQNHRI